MTTRSATLSANVVGRVAPRAPQPTHGVNTQRRLR